MTDTIDPISYNAGIEAVELICPFCGHDPFHYVDNGVGMEAVAVTCCELGDQLFRGMRPAPETVTLGWEEFCEIAGKLRALHRTEPQTAPASCPNCADETDCSNVRQCRAVEEAYAAPADAERPALAERIAQIIAGPMCDATKAEHETMLSGRYKFCTRCGETITKPQISLLDARNKAEAVIALLRAGGWREDMEGAPRDGTPVDLWCEHFDKDSGPRRCANMVRHPETGCWHYASGRVRLQRLEDVLTPTHWMPLPSSPHTDKEG